MKPFKILLLCCVLMSAITNCASQKMDKKSPVVISEVYKQSWHSGVKAGGSGTNIFVALEAPLPKDIQLDSIYFDKFELDLIQDTHNPLLYVGRHLQGPKKDYSLPNLNAAEKVETSKTSTKNSKFELEDNECVIQYRISGKTKYFKNTTLFTKKTPLIPQARPNRE